MGNRLSSWRQSLLLLAWLEVYISGLGSPLAAQEPMLLTSSSEPISTPTNEQPQLSRVTERNILDALHLLKANLVTLKTLSSEQTTSLQRIDGALSGAIKLDETNSKSSVQASENVSSALGEATASSISASTSLTDASTTWKTVQDDQAAASAAATAFEASYASALAMSRSETAWWRAGALVASSTLLGLTFGPVGAAIGSGVGALAGAAWAILKP
jgi:hypothetical protein